MLSDRGPARCAVDLRVSTLGSLCIHGLTRKALRYEASDWVHCQAERHVDTRWACLRVWFCVGYHDPRCRMSGLSHWHGLLPAVPGDKVLYLLCWLQFVMTIHTFIPDFVYSTTWFVTCARPSRKLPFGVSSRRWGRSNACQFLCDWCRWKHCIGERWLQLPLQPTTLTEVAFFGVIKYRRVVLMHLCDWCRWKHCICERSYQRPFSLPHSGILRCSLRLHNKSHILSRLSPRGRFWSLPCSDQRVHMTFVMRPVQDWCDGMHNALITAARSIYVCVLCACMQRRNATRDRPDITDLWFRCVSLMSPYPPWQLHTDLQSKSNQVYLVMQIIW